MSKKMSDDSGPSLKVGEFMPPPAGNVSPVGRIPTVQMEGPAGLVVCNVEDEPQWAARGYKRCEVQVDTLANTGTGVDYTDYTDDQIDTFVQLAGASVAEKKSIKSRKQAIEFLESKNFLPPESEG